MATRREYLIDLDLAKPGRGKFSKDAHEALAKAREAGTVFDDEVETGKVVASASVSDASDHSRPRKGAASPRLDDGRPSVEPGGVRPVSEPQIRRRPVLSLFATDDQGRELEFQTCRKCGYHVSYCGCVSVGLPFGATALLDKSTPLGVD